MILHNPQVPAKSGQLPHYLWDIMKDSGEEKPSQCAELWALRLVIHFSWEEKWQMCDYILIHSGRLLHCRGFPHSLACYPGTHFTAKEVWQRAHAHGIHWACHDLHPPAAAGLTDWWNGLLKTES